MRTPSKKGEREFNPFKVLLVSDFPRVRMGLASLFAREARFAVVGECGTATEALAAVHERRFAIVVLDLSLRSDLGPDLVRDLRAADEQLRILVTSVHEDMLYAGMALHAGARAYVNKNIAPHEVLQALDELVAPLAGGITLT